jgi:hypothetical protein
VSDLVTASPPEPPFDELVATAFSKDPSFSIEVPNGWQQGRGAYGGLVAAYLVRALEGHAQARVLRSLTATLCGPLQAGTAHLVVDTLREGSAVTSLAARIVQHGDVMAHGVGLLGRPRSDASARVLVQRPAWSSWRKAEVVDVGPPVGPVFSSFFEFRPVRGFPFTGAPELRLEGWVRLKRPGNRRDSAYLAACIDAYWPTLLVAETRARPMATIAYTFQPVGTLEGLDPEAPLYYSARLLSEEEGYGVEQRELWGEDGRLVAMNQQTIAVIK